VSASATTENRILLVEDEMLVGMMMSEVLGELGFQVVGPVGHVGDALKAVETEGFRAAVLDVNLHGEMVYPVAEALTAREVPFVFVTGYAADGIDARFAHIPLLQKPIERQSVERVLLPLVDASGRPGTIATAKTLAGRASDGPGRARVVM